MRPFFLLKNEYRLCMKNKLEYNKKIKKIHSVVQSNPKCNIVVTVDFVNKNPLNVFPLKPMNDVELNEDQIEALSNNIKAIKHEFDKKLESTDHSELIEESDCCVEEFTGTKNSA